METEWTPDYSCISVHEALIHTDVYYHLIRLITPSQHARLPWQQTMQRRQVCDVTFCSPLYRCNRSLLAFVPSPSTLGFVATERSTAHRKPG